MRSVGVAPGGSWTDSFEIDLRDWGATEWQPAESTAAISNDPGGLVGREGPAAAACVIEIDVPAIVTTAVRVVEVAVQFAPD